MTRLSFDLAHWLCCLIRLCYINLFLNWSVLFFLNLVLTINVFTDHLYFELVDMGITTVGKTSSTLILLLRLCIQITVGAGLLWSRSDLIETWSMLTLESVVNSLIHWVWMKRWHSSITSPLLLHHLMTFWSFRFQLWLFDWFIIALIEERILTCPVSHFWNL